VTRPLDTAGQDPDRPADSSAQADAKAELATAPWVRRTRREVYRNPWITVVEDDVELPDGRHTLYGVVQCAGAVGVLPFVDDDHVMMIQQYRYVAGRPRWEMPTGGVHEGEDLVAAAQRELGEEIGHHARELVHLASFDSSKSVMEETCHLYLARGLVDAVDVVPDDNEFIHRAVMPFDDVVGMVVGGEITDAMTVIAVLHAERLRHVDPTR
jgi:8-oxo-dGTP pyrophosphatase MutT (NUDIX family)